MKPYSKQAGMTPWIYVYLTVTNSKFKHFSVFEDHDFNFEITDPTVEYIFIQLLFSIIEYAKVYGFIYRF